MMMMMRKTLTLTSDRRHQWRLRSAFQPHDDSWWRTGCMCRAPRWHVLRRQCDGALYGVRDLSPAELCLAGDSRHRNRMCRTVGVCTECQRSSVAGTFVRKKVISHVTQGLVNVSMHEFRALPSTNERTLYILRDMGAVRKVSRLFSLKRSSAQPVLENTLYTPRLLFFRRTQMCHFYS